MDNDGTIVSADGARALVRRDDGLSIVPTEPGGGPPASLNLNAIRIGIEQPAEWREMVDQAWRLDRDLFWNRRMNGVDWHRARLAYTRLARLVGSQEDAIYLIGELQGELANSHMFIAPGADVRAADPHPAALLGVDFGIDGASGRYRMTHVYRGDQTRTRFRAPLGEPALDIRDGDLLLAIDGRQLRAPADPYSLLIDWSGPVILTVARTSDGPGRDIAAEPVASEQQLRQLDWVEANRARVDRLSGGRVGYIFLSDFNDMGSQDFIRQFYPQTDKQGLVIDVRWNGGGFTSQWVLGILRRTVDGGFVNRQGAVTTLPGAVAPRALAIVTNIFSASDGDQFPFFVKQGKLGTVIGERTWGGVRGIKGPWPLIDGTRITIPKDSLFTTGGAWTIENEGTEPDIVVENMPAALAAGVDAQLAAAVAQVLDTIGRNPPAGLHPPAPEPAYPAGGIVPPASFPTPLSTKRGR